MKFLAGILAAAAVLFVTYCVIAQEVDVPKEGRTQQEKLAEQTSYTPKWMGEPRDVWYLEFKNEKIRPIRVCVEEGEIEVYYYMLYTVTNKDDQDHEVEIRIGAWSDKQPCPNMWDETLKRYREMADLKYRDTYIPEVVKAVEKKHFKKKANDEKGLFSLADVTMPEKLGKDTNTGTHGNETGINSPVIKANTTWECVAVFKKISTEMDYLRIFISGLSNDFQVLTHLDTDKVREWRLQDIVVMKNGEMIRCRSEERLNDLRMFVRNEAGTLSERVEKLTDVQKTIKAKSEHSRIKPNQRLVVDMIYEVTYKRLGDEFYVSNDWVEKVEGRWFQWLRLIDTDLSHGPITIQDAPPGR
jgi:hypothetical protein